MRIIVLVIFITACIVPSVWSQTGGAATGQSQVPVTTDQLGRLERAENKLKDWPNLGRYHDANSKVPPPAKGEDRVVFMGDSITDGWKLNEYFPGKAYIKRGIS